MKVYGLTGGIGSGKSTVARMLRERGAKIIDADEVARYVVRPGSEGLAQLVKAFGAGILDSTGALVRQEVGTRVFSNAEARSQLNAITHPLIAAETAARIESLRQCGTAVVFYEAALLVENDAYKTLDGLITVESDASTQQARICTRDGLSAKQAEQRLIAQTSNEARRSAANFVIENKGSLAELTERVDALWNRLNGDALRCEAEVLKKV